MRSRDIKIDPKVWDEGFTAGEKGKSECPYPAGSREAWSWYSGKIEGDAKRQGFSYTRGRNQMPDQPKDRPYRKQEKPPARVINMKLELDLVDAIEEMGKDQAYDFHCAIKNALKWRFGRTRAAEVPTEK